MTDAVGTARRGTDRRVVGIVVLLLTVVLDPTRTLSGSLVGLRGAPVPWTP